MTEPLKPTGFWSYASSDDAASHGRLSQLRRLLADELQLKVGRAPKVHIFQDVAAGRLTVKLRTNSRRPAPGF